MSRAWQDYHDALSGLQRFWCRAARSAFRSCYSRWRRRRHAGEVGGEGQASPDGGPAGDAYCFIKVRQHKMFHREGNDLVLQVPLSYSQAVLGTEIEIPTLGGRHTIEIPKGTQSGEVFQLRGLGIPDPRSGQRGSLLVQTFVEIPKKVGAKQEELLRKLAELEDEHVTPHRKSFLDRVLTYFRHSDDQAAKE